MSKTIDPTNLQSLPSVGPAMARELRDLGYREPADLRGADPEEMYDELLRLRGTHIDRCVLYSLRCAVNVATVDERDPERRKWWNWMDANG